MRVLQILRHAFLTYAILHFEIHLQYCVQSKPGYSICCGSTRTKSLICMCLSYVLAHTLTTTNLAFPLSRFLYALRSTSDSSCCFTTELSKWWCLLLPLQSGALLPDQAVHSMGTGPPQGKCVQCKPA